MSNDDSGEINLQPPPELTIPLWRSLARNLRERFYPAAEPPLEITARPAQVGMLVGDVLSLPWYRTVFTSIGDVIAPETQPPLELDSHAVDAGELISDQIQHGWWTSLLRNLADRVAPERLPPLHLSSAPIRPEAGSQYLMVPRWSSLIEAPRIAAREQGTADPSTPRLRYPITPGQRISPGVVTSRPDPEEIVEAQRALRRARLRVACWMSAAAIQIAFLLGWFILGK